MMIEFSFFCEISLENFYSVLLMLKCFKFSKITIIIIKGCWFSCPYLTFPPATECTNMSKDASCWDYDDYKDSLWLCLFFVLILSTVNRRLSIQIPVKLHWKCTPCRALPKLSTKSFLSLPLIFPRGEHDGKPQWTKFNWFHIRSGADCSNSICGVLFWPGDLLFSCHQTKCYHNISKKHARTPHDYREDNRWCLAWNRTYPHTRGSTDSSCLMQSRRNNRRNRLQTEQTIPDCLLCGESVYIVAHTFYFELTKAGVANKWGDMMEKQH